MKPMLAADFRKKIHMVPRKRLDDFLAPGYEVFLPDDIEGGEVDTDTLVEDFVKFRQRIEAEAENLTVSRCNGIDHSSLN